MIGGIESMAAANAVIQNKSPDVSRLPDGKEFPPLPESESIRRDGESLVIAKPDIALIERTTWQALVERNSVALTESGYVSDGATKSDFPENKGLTDEQKTKIKDETGWSDEIIDCIQNMKQYEILKSAGLTEVEVNGRKCLIKENIDLDCADADGITNRERIARGLAPLDSKTGKPIELHHLGQKANSPLVELTEEEHRTGDYEGGKKNQSLWHNNSIETEVHGESNTWDSERRAHWEARSKQISGGNN